MINAKLQNIIDTKSAIGNAIVNKGGTITGATPFYSYASQIDNISTGSVLTGDATVNDVLIGKSFYSSDANTILTGQSLATVVKTRGSVSNTFTSTGVYNIVASPNSPKLVVLFGNGGSGGIGVTGSSGGGGGGGGYINSFLVFNNTQINVTHIGGVGGSLNTNVSFMNKVYTAANGQAGYRGNDSGDFQSGGGNGGAGGGPSVFNTSTNTFTTGISPYGAHGFTSTFGTSFAAAAHNQTFRPRTDSNSWAFYVSVGNSGVSPGGTKTGGPGYVGQGGQRGNDFYQENGQTASRVYATGGGGGGGYGIGGKGGNCFMHSNGYWNGTVGLAGGFGAGGGGGGDGLSVRSGVPASYAGGSAGQGVVAVFNVTLGQINNFQSLL